MLTHTITRCRPFETRTPYLEKKAIFIRSDEKQTFPLYYNKEFRRLTLGSGLYTGPTLHSFGPVRTGTFCTSSSSLVISWPRQTVDGKPGNRKTGDKLFQQFELNPVVLCTKLIRCTRYVETGDMYRIGSGELVVLFVYLNIVNMTLCQHDQIHKHVHTPIDVNPRLNHRSLCGLIKS